MTIDETIRCALSNILSSVAKSCNAPASSSTHLDSAIALLASVCDWRPKNEELLGILNDAVEDSTPYCSECDSCGEPPCCPDFMCKYWRVYVIDYCEMMIQDDGLEHVSKGDSFDYGYKLALEELIKYTRDHDETPKIVR